MKISGVLAMILAGLSSSATAQHAGHQLGTISFPTSCNAEASQSFSIGAAWLHSFEYKEAEGAFQAAVAADPTCAIAYWGVAMSNNHPLWAPPSVAELAKGSVAIEQARRIGARTSRERDYIEAIAPFYETAGTLDHSARTYAYADAMKRLHLSYPDDVEAAVFYALALIAAGTMDTDANYGREKEAAAILNRVLVRHPNHPGVAHYLIHGYDFPQLAHLALPAARTYAGIAPASAHAQHMPSHIFTRLGLWEESVRSNLAAEAAAKAYATAHSLPGAWDEQLHAIDYLAYAYLQLGDEDKARVVLDRLAAIHQIDPPNFKVAFTLTAVPARYVLERRDWKGAVALQLLPASRNAVAWEKFGWALANIHFARAVGAARLGIVNQARLEIARLEEIRQRLPVRKGEYDWGTQVEIQRQVASAWLAFAEGKQSDAVGLMRQAAALDEATEKHPVTPGAILPAREQLGELLLAVGKPAEALSAFEASLLRAPGRLNSILGAARAARLSGNLAKARLWEGRIPRLNISHGRKRLP